ncbi:MAG: transporter substrate-binding domain-containing protein [Methylococcales bacterium]|nr:transporter substrate-binding domain-containing protein [Methylococcales bacterium]
MNSKTLLSALLLTFVFSIPTWAKEINVGFGQDKSPFIIGQTGKGLEIEIFQAALANKGYSVKVINMSRNRMKQAFQTLPTLDAIAGIAKVEGEDLYYVGEFIYFEDYIFTKTDNHLTINKISDLKGLEIVAWQNAHRELGAEFEELFQPEPKADYKKLYNESSNQKNQNMMFWTNRVKVIICDKTIFSWYRKQLKNEVDTHADITTHPIFPKREFYSAVFKDKKIADDFAAGLAEIKKSGLYDQLYRNYTE